MSLEDRAAIGANYIPAPLGSAEEIIISTHNLLINSKLSKDDLDFVFPEGAIVFDSFKNASVRAGADGVLRPLR